MTDHTFLNEITLCGINDGDLYRQRITPIITNLRRKIAKGTYKADLALDLWQYAADDMVRRYSVEHMGHARPTLTIVSKADRRVIAKALAEHYSDELGGTLGDSLNRSLNAFSS
jgi:hypothetical protein